MLSIDKVLFPVDFSEGCRSALARNLQSALIVMHAVPASVPLRMGVHRVTMRPLRYRETTRNTSWTHCCKAQASPLKRRSNGAPGGSGRTPGGAHRRGSAGHRTQKPRRRAGCHRCWRTNKKISVPRLYSARGNPPRQCVFGLNGSRKSMPRKRAHLRILFLS